jgi:hypothetical protein
MTVRASASHRSSAFEPLESRQLFAAGFHTSAPAYLTPTGPGVEVTPLLNAGDSVNGYRMVGVPDGLGAYDNGDGTFTVLMNHELRPTVGTVRAHGGKGSFVSKWVIDKATGDVLSGQDQVKTLFLYDPATQAYVNAATAFNRFCSATLAEPSAFFNPATGLGTTERIFTNGEEATTGRAFAHVVSSGESYELPGMGNFAFENVVPSPYPQDLTIVGAQDDGNRLFTGEGAGTGTQEVPSEVYFYVGRKKSAGSVIDRAGLTGGVLSGLKVVGAANEAAVTSGSRFTLASVGDVSAWDDAQLQAASIASGVTQFRRPEDGSWDPNNPNVYYFVTTDAFAGDTRLWKLTFDDIRNPQAGGTIEVAQDSPAAAPGEMFDNITVNSNSDVLIQEDPGNQPYVARIWQHDASTGDLAPVAEHARRFFDPTYAGPDKNFLTQDEESSGVIDVSTILGPGHYLADVQAHFPINAANPRGFDNPDELVEGGQLLLINTSAAKATLEGGTLNVTGTVNDDVIDVDHRGNDVVVTFNGTAIGTFDKRDVKSVWVAGFWGDDRIAVNPNVQATAVIEGGAGRDILTGRRERDTIID